MKCASGMDSSWVLDNSRARPQRATAAASFASRPPVPCPVIVPRLKVASACPSSEALAYHLTASRSLWLTPSPCMKSVARENMAADVLGVWFAFVDARSYHLAAAASLCSTPRPSSHMQPYLYWASGSPCSPARRYHFAASVSFCSTPLPPSS